jgi:hypothetical protein
MSGIAASGTINLGITSTCRVAKVYGSLPFDKLSVGISEKAVGE